MAKSIKEVEKKVKEAEKKAAKLVEEWKEEAPKAVERLKEEAPKAIQAASAKTVELKQNAKAAVEKAPRKSREIVYLQYAGKEIDKDQIIKQVKEIWTKQLGHKVGEINTMTLYLKPEEEKAYFVINGAETGSVEL